MDGRIVRILTATHILTRYHPSTGGGEAIALCFMRHRNKTALSTNTSSPPVPRPPPVGRRSAVLDPSWETRARDAERLVVCRRIPGNQASPYETANLGYSEPKHMTTCGFVGENTHM